MTNLIGPGALRLERRLAGSCERVWDLLVDPELRATWLAGGALEHGRGGRVTLAFRHDTLTDVDDPPPDAYRSTAAGGHLARGVVTTWAPPHRFAHTWEDGTETSEVGFALTDEGAAVRLTVVHRRVDTRAGIVGVAAGWDAHLGLLAAVVEGGPRPAYWRAFVASEARHAEAFAGRAEADGRPTGYPALRALPGEGFVLEFDRVVAAPVASVWRTLADPERRDRWYPAELRFEGTVGGWARERFPDDPAPVSEGRVTGWQEGRRLSFVFDGDPTSPEPSVHHAQSVDVELVPEGPSTRVAFAYGFGDRTLAPDVGAGWHVCLDALAAVAEGREGTSGATDGVHGAAADGATDIEALRRGYAAWLAEPFGDGGTGSA